MALGIPGTPALLPEPSGIVPALLASGGQIMLLQQRHRSFQKQSCVLRVLAFCPDCIECICIDHMAEFKAS